MCFTQPPRSCACSTGLDVLQSNRKKNMHCDCVDSNSPWVHRSCLPPLPVDSGYKLLHLAAEHLAAACVVLVLQFTHLQTCVPSSNSLSLAASDGTSTTLQQDRQHAASSQHHCHTACKVKQCCKCLRVASSGLALC